MTNLFAGSVIRLRAVEPSDWEYFYNANLQDTDAGQLTDEVWFPTSVDFVRSFTEHESRRRGNDSEGFRFAIELLATGEMVGTLNTININRRCGTFMYGIAIATSHQRQGIASEAIRLVLRYYFHERNFQKVNVEVFGYDEPSMRLHEKLGFVLEGQLRRFIYAKGAYHDALYYGMTREEFDEIHGAEMFVDPTRSA